MHAESLRGFVEGALSGMHAESLRGFVARGEGALTGALATNCVEMVRC